MTRDTQILNSKLVTTASSPIVERNIDEISQFSALFAFPEVIIAR